VRPGISAAELKAAYRDLAKVWHPDRFSHDPRLQQKAQEKLKEINEAYEQLISGKTPRPRSAPPPPTERSARRARATRFDQDPFAQPSTASSRPLHWHWVALPVLLFVVVFIYTTRSLIQARNQGVQAASQQVETSVGRPETEASNSARVNNETDSARPQSKSAATPLREQNSTEVAAVTPVQAAPEQVKTVTVTIDPNTGLLARADCPTKTRMTYPSGSEPHGYCTATHGPAASDSKDSKLKSFAKRVGSPSKWLDSGSSKEKADTKQNQ
jgi:hypothetical protein